MIVFVALGVLVDGFFAIVNFYPVAPHPSRGPKRYVVMQLGEPQAAWFQTNVLGDFNAEFNTNVEVLRVSDEEQLQAATAKYGPDVLLVALPATQIAAAVTSKLVRPFTDVVSPATIAADFKPLGDRVLAPGRFRDTQYFLPQMSKLDVAVFRISKVRDAVLHWAVLRPEIDAALKAVNGRGLPAGYELDSSPVRWDEYDMFVLAYYWARRVYDGKPARPRVGHRTGDEIDGQQDIAAALFRMGADDKTFGAFDSRAAIDFFQWEALFRQEGLYPAEMLGTKPFDDEAMIHGLQNGDLFFASIDSMEAFTLHGGSHAGTSSHIDDPADLEFTSFPRGASLELDAKGKQARIGKSFSFHENWVWALSTETPRPDLAYELVQFLWRPEIHARQCEALGILPQHPEVLGERISTFRLEWMSHVFEAGLTQAGEPIPASLVEKGFGSVYAQLWSKIVAGGVPPVPESAILEILKAPPPARTLKVETADMAAEIKTPEPTEPETETDQETEAERAPTDVQDWESEVVIQPRDPAAPPVPSKPPARAQGARP